MELMEYTSMEVVGKSIFMFIDDRDKDEFDKLWQITKNGGKHIEQEMRHVTKNGHRWFLSTFTLLLLFETLLLLLLTLLLLDFTLLELSLLEF